LEKFTGQIEWLRNRLEEPLPGRNAQERMIGRVLPIPKVAPVNARLSAVLCLLFPVAGELNILLMKRMEDGTAHSGQVSFPGGSYEPEDIELKNTALREAEEEVGIIANRVDVLGALTPIYIPASNFNVFPFIGFISDRPTYILSHSEVAHTLEVPLKCLFHPNRKIKKDVISPAIKKVIPNVNAYELEDDTIIWGATAMIISELETILEEYAL